MENRPILRKVVIVAVVSTGIFLAARQFKNPREAYRALKTMLFLGFLNALSGSMTAWSMVLNGVNAALGLVAGRRPRDMPLPPPGVRLRTGAHGSTLHPAMASFRALLHPSCWQQGTLGHTGDPALYLYMARALRRFPRLRAWCRGVPMAALSDEALFSIPARDSHVLEVMYGGPGGEDPPFCSADLRDWRDALGAQLQSLHSQGALPQPLAALTQYATTQPCMVSPHSDWEPTPGFDAAPVFSFAGVAWMAVYHLGAVSALRERWDLTHADVRLCGASSGAIVAATAGSGALVSDALVRCFEQWADSNAAVLGPITAMSGIIQEGLVNMTPSTAHTALHHRLKVVVSAAQPPASQEEEGEDPSAHAVEDAVPSPLHQLGFQHILGEELLPHRAHVTEFPSRQALMDTIAASCHVPGYSGGVAGAPLPAHLVHAKHPRVRAAQGYDAGRARHASVLMFDGALTDNFPRWHGDVEWRWMGGLRGDGPRPSPADFDPDKDGLTVTVCPAPGFGTISPPFKLRDTGTMYEGGGATACGAPGEPFAPGAEDSPPSFTVGPGMAFGGWKAISALMPPSTEEWWGAFFAGRGHTQWWMESHGFLPRPPAQLQPKSGK